MVCRLHKMLYSLKQSGRQWYIRMSKALNNLGFKRASSDHGVFVRISGSSVFYIAVHVDDFTLVSNSLADIKTFKSEISKSFSISDLGEIHWLLGMKIERVRSDKSLSIMQSTYIDTLIERFRQTDAQPLSCPLEPSITLLKKDCPTTDKDHAKMESTPYKELIRSLMYAAICMRPDISFAVSMLSQFMVNPGKVHWKAALHVLRYLKGTREMGLWFGYTDDTKTDAIAAFSDADWASQEHQHSFFVTSIR
jgi:hypothetical protein